MKEKLIRFMYGRYGIDSLGKLLIAAALILMLIAGWTNSSVLSILSWFCIIYAYFRMVSGGGGGGSSENQWYLSKTAKIRNFFSRQKYMMQQRKTHHIYKCPTCHQKIRVPKGRGKIEISCPKCQTKFIKKS